MELVNKLMKQAVSENIFPGGVLLVFWEDSIIFFKAYGYANIFSKRRMDEDTIFDLASLTKPLATTLAIMILIQQHKLDLEQDIGSVLPQFDKTEKSNIKISHLLYHNSGLPDYRPYYRKLRKLPIDTRIFVLRDLLVKEPLLHPIGQKVLYSDIGFMILRWVVESVSGSRLDQFVYEKIYRPLKIENLFFIDLDSERRNGKFAATELCPWRNILLEGAVHDDNAYVMGGIEGHAGLFGTANDVNILLSELLAAFNNRSLIHVFQKDLVNKFFERQEDSGRALGFDTPSLFDSNCGNYFSKKSIGHLGFTGTSFWVDLERSVIVLLLTNRIHPSRDNLKIKVFRSKLHDTVLKNIQMKNKN
jgi:CubicO group peptidase (beta-lactamase class C family)